MKRGIAGLILLAVSATAWSGDPCAGKVAASILAFDREHHEGAGLLVNQCGRPVRVEVLVVAQNHDGFPVARLRTTVQAGAAPLSVFQAGLPFVQSMIRLSGYGTEVAAIEALDAASGHTAQFVVEPPPAPHL